MSTENATAPEHTWEISKENVKPIKTGRKLKGLQIRSGPEDHVTLEQQAEKFEDEIKASADGEDPLANWIRYLTWIRQAYPSDSSKTMLLLEKCTEHFKTSDKYKNDPRYVKLWIEYADLVPAAGEIFAFLQSNKIGERVALFWIAWAFVAEKHENFTLTDKIFQKGIHKRAEPKDVLVKRHQQFQRRMARHYLNQSTAAAETGEEKETTRAALGKLSRAQASGATSSRVAVPPANVNNSSSTRGSMQAQSTALPQSQSRASTGQAGPANAIGFEIFSDSRPSGGAAPAAAMLMENKDWTRLAPQHAVRKENDAPVEKFAQTAPIGSAVTARREGPVVRADEIFVDPEFERVSDEQDEDEEIAGPNIRRQLDSVRSHALEVHSTPSDMEKVFKDPLAKHKQGEGVVVPVAPSRSSKHSSRENEGSKDKAREKGREKEKERDRSSRTLQQSSSKAKPEAEMPPPVTPGGFAIFSDAPAPTEEVKPTRRSATADAAEAKKPKPTLTAAKPKTAPSAGFAIFEDENSAAASSAKKKSSALAPAKASSMGFSIFEESVKPAEKPVEKRAVAPASTSRMETKAQPFSVFNDMEDELETAYDDTTINTKIAKMDIDAMFFDCDDAAPAASKPLNLTASSSVVFPAASSIVDAKHGLSSIPEGGEGGKKDSGFVVFDDFSVIKSDSMHRSHDVSADSPYSNYNPSPLNPRGTGAHIDSSAVSVRKNKKRGLSGDAPEQCSKAMKNSLYLSASSDSNASGELDSMQYSAQPTRPLASKSGGALSFKSTQPIATAAGRRKGVEKTGTTPAVAVPGPHPSPLSKTTALQQKKDNLLAAVGAASMTDKKTTGPPVSDDSPHSFKRRVRRSSSTVDGKKQSSSVLVTLGASHHDQQEKEPFLVFCEKGEKELGGAVPSPHQATLTSRASLQTPTTPTMDNKRESTHHTLPPQDTRSAAMPKRTTSQQKRILARKRKFFSPRQQSTTPQGTVINVSPRRLLPVKCLDSLQALGVSRVQPTAGVGKSTFESKGLTNIENNPLEEATMTRAEMLLYRLQMRHQSHPEASTPSSSSSTCNVVKTTVQATAAGTHHAVKTYATGQHRGTSSAVTPRSISRSVCSQDSSTRSSEQKPTQWDTCRKEGITSSYLDNIDDIQRLYGSLKSLEIRPVLIINEKLSLHKALGGAKGYDYDRSHNFPAVKKAVLSKAQWAMIAAFVGRGTFGYVLLARQSSFQSAQSPAVGPVVLKVDHRHQFVVWEATLHARIAARLVTDGEKDNRQYRLSLLPPLGLCLYQEASVLIMPYCDMGDLVFCANYLNHMCEGYTHEHLNVVIGLQMLRAVQFIHSKRILHRDIKLNNWVIRADNTCLCGINIVLIDFGKGVDVDAFLRSNEARDAPGPHIYTSDLSGLAKTQYNMLFGKEAKFSSESCAEIHSSPGGYNVWTAVAAADRVQGTAFTSQRGKIIITTPSRPLRRLHTTGFWNAPLWSLLFVPVLSHCTVQSRATDYTAAVITAFEEYLQSLDLTSLQKAARNFMVGLSRYHADKVSN